MQELAIHGGPKAIGWPLTAHPKWGYDELREVLDVFASGHYYRYEGEKVAAFEEAFAAAYGVKHAVASTSGTAAIHIALGMIDPEPGSEVIIGPITDLGSVVPVLYQQCIPVFADTDPQTFCMDPADLERRISQRTVAIMPVHLFGNPCDMEAIMEIAARHDLIVIEDCSQAHYTAYKGRICGTIGHIGAFSLQASKHITTGEGGMTITNDDNLGERGALFQDKGWARGGWGPRAYRLLGLNYRMTELQGAIGLAQLRKLKDIVARRHALGSRLTELVSGAPGIRPQQPTPGGKITYWLYGLAVEPDAPYSAHQFAEAVQAEGLSCSAGYIGQPIFLCAEACAAKQTFGTSQLPFALPGVEQIDYTEGTCPRTTELLQRMLTLPLSEHYTERDIDEIAGALRKVAFRLAGAASARCRAGVPPPATPGAAWKPRPTGTNRGAAPQAGPRPSQGRMLHAVFTAPYQIIIEETEIPSPGPDEVLIKVAACGICGTDLKINEGHYLGHLPVTPGHELAGHVVALGSAVTGLSGGDAVAVNPNLPCRRCVFCRTGQPHLCENSQAVGVTRAGGFAEYCAAPAELAIRIPAGLAPELAAMMEPTSCCLHGIDLAGVKPGSSVMILGGGSIGLLLLQLARASGATWTAVSEPRPEKRDLALRLGATCAVAPAQIALLAKSLPGGGADVVIEAAGVPQTALAAMDLVRPGGMVLLFGVCPPDCWMPIVPYHVFHKEITIKGSYTNPFTDTRALDVLATRRVEVEPLISHVFAIEGIEKGIAEVRAGNTVKAQVRPTRR